MKGLTVNITEVQEVFVDLHVHSTASDGTFAPEDLITIAKERGLTAVALTDHDTVKGIPAFFEAASGSSVEAIVGTEIGVANDKERGLIEVHILGYLFDPDEKHLSRALLNLEEAKSAWLQHQIDVLVNVLKVDLTVEEVQKANPGINVIRRPHIWNVLTPKVKGSLEKERYYRRSDFEGDLHASKAFEVELEEALELIHGAGGVAVLAHPGFSRALEPEKLIEFCHGKGIDGVEVIYPYFYEDTLSVTNKDRALMDMAYRCADRLGLLMTGGSDFHGEPVKKVRMGEVEVPYSHLDALKKCRDKLVGRK